MRLRLVCLVSALIFAAAAQAREVKVFAAASLSDAMAEVAVAFAKTSAHRIKLVLAGSSTLARQIEAGAAADIFLSADEAWMAYLAERKLIEPSSQRGLLTNTLVLVMPRREAIKSVNLTTDQWLAALGQGRIAVGDPAHVPVGKYAMASLQAMGVWPRVSRRLATALDTRAALALVERGEAAAGIVYATDAGASRGVHVVGQFPANADVAISYPIARLAHATDGATKAAYAFLVGTGAAKIFRQHGFGLR